MRTRALSFICFVQVAWLGGCAEDHDASPGRVLPPSDSAHEDSGMPDSGVEGGPVVIGVPADQAAPPEVECPTSVPQIIISAVEQLAAYQGIHCVQGAVQIKVHTEDLSALSLLRRVGSLQIESPAGAVQTMLPAVQQMTSLVRVDGELSLRGTVTNPDGWQLPALRWVGGRLILDGQLAEAGVFPALERVGEIFVQSIMPITGDPFPVLKNVGGTLNLGEHQIPWRAVERIGSDLVIGGPGVGLASLQKLRAVGGSVRVRETDIADILSLPNLERVNGTFELLGNPTLSRIDLPKLSHLGSVDIRLNPRLSRCTIDALLEKLHLDDVGDVCCNLDCESCANGQCSP